MFQLFVKVLEVFENHTLIVRPKPEMRSSLDAHTKLTSDSRVSSLTAGGLVRRLLAVQLPGTTY